MVLSADEMFVAPTFNRSQSDAHSTNSDIPILGDGAVPGLNFPFGGLESPLDSDGFGFDPPEQMRMLQATNSWSAFEDSGFNSTSLDLRDFDISVTKNQLDLGHILSLPGWRRCIPEDAVGLLTNYSAPGISSSESYKSITQTS